MTSSQSARGAYRLANRRPLEAFRRQSLEARDAPCSSVNPLVVAAPRDRSIPFSRLTTRRRDLNKRCRHTQGLTISRYKGSLLAGMSNDSAVTDAELVERARRGDAAAFDTLVRRYLRAAYALALSLTHDHHDAEDVCQEACVRSLAHLGECRTPARFAGWFFAIVRSAAMHWQRSERVRRTESLEVHDHANADDPGRDAEQTELRARLAAALGILE